MKLNKHDRKYKEYKKLYKRFEELRKIKYKNKNFNSKLESEYDKLYVLLFDSGKYEEFNIHLDKSFPSYKDRSKVKNKLNQFKNGDLEDIFNEKIPREYEY